MNNSNGYDAQAVEIKMEDITSCGKNAKMLRRVMDNDADLTKVIVCPRGEASRILDHRHVFTPTNVRELKWLGNFVANNTHLQDLSLFSLRLLDIDGLQQFCAGLGRNGSIRELFLSGFGGSRAILFDMLIPFFRNNPSLEELSLVNCHRGEEDCERIASALLECGKSLKRFAIHSDRGHGGVFDIIFALMEHPHLRSLRIHNANIGRSECEMLAILLRRANRRIDVLDLCHNGIDDEGVEDLVDALASGNKLRTLNLAHNRSITARGCRAIATLLDSPNSTLEVLHLADIGSGVNEEGLSIFAYALARNRKLKELILSELGGKPQGWNAFSKLLCDPSSVDDTFLSNHTLRYVWVGSFLLPKEVEGYLTLNRTNDKKRVAVVKILMHHRHFDLRPLFRWEFKALPLVVDWFDAAARRLSDVEVGRRKLSSIFQFVRGMPASYVESRSGRGSSEARAAGSKLER